MIHQRILWTFTTILFIASAGFSAYEVQWDSGYTLVVRDAKNIHLSCAPDGGNYMSYVVTGRETLENIIHDGTPSIHVVTDLSSIHHVYSAISFSQNVPMIAYTDMIRDAVLIKYFLSNQWSTETEIPYTENSRYVRTVIDGPDKFIAFSSQNEGSSICYLRIATNTTGPWLTESTFILSMTNISDNFDICMGPDDKLHLAWWEASTEILRHAVRNAANAYIADDIAENIERCHWLDLEFMSPDIPVVGFTQEPSGLPSTVKVAYKVGTNWSVEDVFQGRNFNAVDMCLDNSGLFTTPNFCFLLHQFDGYHCINRSYPYWNNTLLNWSEVSPASEIQLDWNQQNNEIAAFINTPDTQRVWFFTGYPTNSTPTPTPMPTKTPTFIYTSTPTRTPASPPTKTPKPPPTKTPASPPTKTPASPPTKTPTPGPTHQATNTPMECTEFGVIIDMPATTYHAGDEFYCRVFSCNPTDTSYSDIPLFVILDIYGNYYFAPSFTDYDHYSLLLVPGFNKTMVIQSISWPTVESVCSNVWFHAGMTDRAITELLGDPDSFMFGWD
ncbi:hypothetical protein K8T06_08765 [bacterium]|nr:hypothetical protein [bacterium]